jgi:phosphomannomutase
MKNIVLFDMDGTLTPARQSMERPVTDKLIQLQRAGFEIGIVTGSDLEYVKEQCQDLFKHIAVDINAIHFMPCNGTKYYRIHNANFQTIYEKNMREKLGENRWRRLIRIIINLQHSLINANRYLPLTGNFINYRGSTLNWCPIGRQANTLDRSAWKIWDKHHWIRHKWFKFAREELDNAGLEDVVIKMGGDTSFDIYPEGWDKTYAFKNFENYDKIYFVGDRCGPDGNDKEAYELAGDLGFITEGPEQTIKIIDQIITENK